MKNTVFPHKFWRPFLDCMPQLFFRPQYVWFPVHLKGHLIPLCYETLVVNWQNWLFTLFHQSRSVLSPNPIVLVTIGMFSWQNHSWKLSQLIVCLVIKCKFPISWWRHQMEKKFHETLCEENPPVTGQWRGVLMFSLTCAWSNDWTNNRGSGDLRRHRHYDVIAMIFTHTKDLLAVSH